MEAELKKQIQDQTDAANILLKDLVTLAKLAKQVVYNCNFDGSMAAEVYTLNHLSEEVIQRYTKKGK